MIHWTDCIPQNALVRNVKGVGGIMKKDSYSIFQNRGTLQERNQIHKTMVAQILKSEFKKEFKTCRILVGDQFFTVDLMSNDDEIAAKIINSGRTSHNKISSGKFQQILSAILVLRSIESKRKLLIFTNKKMHENFFSSIKSMPTPICDTVQGIEIAWIPLSDEFDNYEYSEPRTNFRINEDGFRQTRRNQE
jgi:hypothetical protein